uniref:Uncharacterized protein n=1 Tax=Physcomitrium patens TaxID=3218 RepID=A0A2K1KG51_PHYPA|nr:hypothetical protein PHYPA_009126 [Physcomitrium patens]
MLMGDQRCETSRVFSAGLSQEMHRLIILPLILLLRLLLCLLLQRWDHAPCAASLFVCTASLCRHAFSCVCGIDLGASPQARIPRSDQILSTPTASHTHALIDGCLILIS